MTQDVERAVLARIALAHLVEPGNRDLGELVRRFGPVAALAALTAGRVPEELYSLAAPRLADAPDPYRLAARAQAVAARLGATLLTPEHEQWPHQLADLVRISRNTGRRVDRDTYPPLCFWVRGDGGLADACERSVAVVGARACTEYGTYVANELAYGLADRGWTVVSGGAFGIDAVAHRAALAASGETVAVLACGVDRPYPAGHAGLFERIVEGGGLLLSEWPPGSDPHKHRFLIRNRVIAAATRGTIVVEASARSGARFTLHRARLLGRSALAVPGPVTSELSQGCHEELRMENTRLVTSVAEVIEEVGRIGEELGGPVRGAEQPHDRLTALQAQVLDGVLPRRARTAEQVAAACGVSARDARSTLPGLELLGFVVAHGLGYRLVPAPKPSRPDGEPA
jgi:DNA processing protein